MSFLLRLTPVFGKHGLPHNYLGLPQGGILRTLRTDLIKLTLSGRKSLIFPTQPGSQSVSPKPEAITSPKNLFIMQILGFLTISTASDLWGCSLVICVLTRIPGGFNTWQSFRTSKHAFYWWLLNDVSLIPPVWELLP